MPSQPAGAVLNFNDAFDNYWVMKVYRIKREKMNERGCATIEKEMTCVMTGINETDLSIKKQVMQGLNKKRKKKGW